MAWNIKVVTNALSLTQAQATKLVDLLESTWSEFDTYVDWVGEKPELVDFFSGEELEFVDDFMEHRDYLHDDKMQAALLAVGAEGFVTFADFEGDNRGHAWTHTFKDGKYSYAYGNVRQLSNGRIADDVAKVPQIGFDEFVKLGFNKAPFNGNAFVITGDMATISRRLMEDVISRLGGRTSSSLSSKTFALIAGAAHGPAKMAKAKERGITIWDEEMFLIQAGLKEAPAVAVAPEADAVKTPYGWHFEEYHVATGEVVRDGFSRTDVTGMKSKVKGFDYRIVPVFTA